MIVLDQIRFFKNLVLYFQGKLLGIMLDLYFREEIPNPVVLAAALNNLKSLRELQIHFILPFKYTISFPPN